MSSKSFDVEYDTTAFVCGKGNLKYRVLFGDSFTKGAIATAKKGGDMGLIDMSESQQMGLLELLLAEGFLGRISLSGLPSPTCQHALCSEDALRKVNNAPTDVVLHLSGISLRSPETGEVIDRVLLALCEAHYKVLEARYLADANWTLKLGKK